MPAVRASMAAALQAHQPEWAHSLAEFVRLWREDLRRWRDVLAQVRPSGDLGVALERLGLGDEVAHDGML